MVFLVHLVVLSIVQDHVWVLFDFSGAQNPLPPVPSAGAPKTIAKAREERGIDAKGGDASADADADADAAESKDAMEDGSMHMASRDDAEDAGNDV